MPIRQLAPDVAAKIAAGEVVERPASVVKELIENSIDAGATQIRVDLSGGGLQLIRVTDNGSGIIPDELALALARHATSKVAQIADLEHIRSLGFRGEALASIAAVAEVTLVSRARGAEQGAQVSALNGQISDVVLSAAAEGTTITVRNLFSAVPARLKFLKSRNTEVSHCHHLLEQYALTYPEIRFSVFSDSRQIFATAGDGQLSSVIVEVYGLPIAEQMVMISGNDHPEDPQYPVVHGYVSQPSCYKSTRQHISFFVNRRWVLSRMLTAAVEGAYHSLLLPGRHPIAVVNIQIDPTMMDVNVHPAKTEIRFLKERRVFAAILRAFKFRGAYNAIAQLTPEQRSRGVIAFSSGNHAQAIALSARLLGASATVVMPSDVPDIKLAATRGYGAKVILYNRLTEDREEIGRRLSEEHGFTLIPPYDYPHIMAGQGTVAKEFIEEVGKLDFLITPLGGGGLLSGCAVASRAINPHGTILGVEPEAGNDGQRSFQSGHIIHIDPPTTIADGAQTQHLGRYTFPVIHKLVNDIVTVSDAQLVDTLKFFATRMKIFLEPTGCLAAAAVFSKKIDVRGKKVGIVLSGGNIDLTRFASLVTGS